MYTLDANAGGGASVGANPASTATRGRWSVGCGTRRADNELLITVASGGYAPEEVIPPGATALICCVTNVAKAPNVAAALRGAADEDDDYTVNVSIT